MKRVIYNVFILFLMALTSCDDYSIDKKLVPEIDILEEIIVAPKSERYVISLKSTYPWYAEASASWIKMVRYRGQYIKNDSIVMEVTENPEMEAREGWIDVKLMDQMNKKVHIVQNGRGSLITLSKDKVIFNRNGGETEIGVTTQIEWEIVDEELQGIEATKIDNSKLKLVVSPNDSGNEKTQIVILKSVDGTTEAKLTVTQSHLTDILSISLNDEEKDILLEKNNSEMTIPVSLNMNYQCAVSSEWIDITETPQFEGDVVKDIDIKVSVSENNGLEERYGYVCIKNEDETVTDTLYISQMAHSKRIYVKAGNVSGDGTSWERAFGTIEDGISACTHYGDMEVWVAKGEYQLRDWIEFKKVCYYGGFDGYEDKLKDRNMNNKSVLIASPTNTWPSVYGYALSDASCVVDGFVFTGSRGTQGEGSLVFYDNWIFRNNIVTGNQSVRDAGGTYSKAMVINCLIYGNKSLNNSSTVNATAGAKIYNCSIVNNTSEGNSSSCGLRLGNNSEVYNSILWNNNHTTGDNDNVYLDNNTAKIYNCAVEGELTFNNTPNVLQNCISLSSNNTDLNGPNFVSPEEHNYSLTDSSPLIDKGIDWTQLDYLFDIVGNYRIYGSSIDIGAYEFIK